ncbi:hypothetical protein [Kitasatospora sp. NPDC088783]|uniref:hypothetical protein n=1 Tax=Kitasatospora sp. NPDC088783 TaxID=3364077 RepID=UPI0038023080
MPGTALADPAHLRPTEHLDPGRQDALLLHIVLALPVDVIADLTGAEAATVHIRLRGPTASIRERTGPRPGDGGR